MSTNSINSIIQLLKEFEPITLEQMDEVSFLKRTETKYVFHRSRLEDLLNEMHSLFSLLIINDSGIQDYKTVYFDTPNFDMFQQHHNGVRDRFKIRARQYINSNLFFLEVKTKNNKGVTSKKRLKTNSLDIDIQQNKSGFLDGKTPFSNSELKESIKIQFSRITLVNEKTPERITIDWNLSYINPKTGKELEQPNVCILEIKRSRNTKNRELDSVLKKLKIYPMKFSKYCMGISQLELSLKTNRFKPWIHRLRKEEIIN
jgi:hypothetical protein